MWESQEGEQPVLIQIDAVIPDLIAILFDLLVRIARGVNQELAVGFEEGVDFGWQPVNRPPALGVKMAETRDNSIDQAIV